MADALTIVDTASYDASKESSANKINTEASEAKPSILPGWLNFYTDIMQNVRNYQIALEKQNYADLTKFDLVISQKIVDYIKKLNDNSKSKTKTKTDTSSDADLKKQLKDRIREALKTATDLNVSTIKESFRKAFSTKDLKSEKEVVDSIENAISSYKDTIRDIIDSNLSQIKATIDEIRRGKKSEAIKEVAEKRKAGLEIENKVVENTLFNVKVQLDKRKEEFQELVSSFSLKLGYKLFDVFKANVRLLKTSNKISQTISAKNVINSNNSLTKTDTSTANVLDLDSKQIESGISRFFKRKFLPGVKKTLRWTGAIILASIWRFSVFFLKHLKNIAKTAVRFVFVDFWRILGRFTRRIASTVKTIFSISKSIYDIVFKNSFAKTLYAFFRSYPGAYALGWLFGSIWWIVKKKLNIDNFVELKEKFSSKISEYGTALVEKLKKIPSLSEIIEKFRETKLYKTAVVAVKTLKYLYNTFEPIVEKYLLPAIAGIASFLSIFTGREIKSLNVYSRTKYGSMAALSRLEKAGKIIKGKGGIAALISGAVVIGSAFAAYSYEKKELEKADKYRKDLKFNEFSLGDGNALKEALPEVLHRGVQTTEGIVSRITKGTNNEALASAARQLLFINDGIQEEFDDYNEHVKFLESILVNDYLKKEDNFSKIAQEDIVPIELRNKILSFNGKRMFEASLIEKFGKLNYREQLLFLKVTLDFKKKLVGSKLKELYENRETLSQNRNAFLTFQDSFYNPDFSQVALKVTEERLKMPGGLLEYNPQRIRALEEEKKLLDAEIESHGNRLDFTYTTTDGIRRNAGEYLQDITAELQSAKTPGQFGLNPTGKYTSELGSSLLEKTFNQAKFIEAVRNILSILKNAAIVKIDQIVSFSHFSEQRNSIIKSFEEIFTSLADNGVERKIETGIGEITPLNIENSAYSIFEESLNDSLQQIKQKFDLGNLLEEKISDTKNFIEELKKENQDKINKEIDNCMSTIKKKLTTIKGFVEDKLNRGL